MTLLEAIVAMVILSLAGIGCIELAHSAAQLQARSVEWNDAISEAESRMASVLTSAPLRSNVSVASQHNGSFSQHEVVVARTAWKNGLDDVTVRVSLTDGSTFTLHRLVPALRSAR